MTETLATIANLGILVFVLASMVSVGLSLRVSEILEPLADWRLVVMGLVGNFVVAPVAAWGIAELVGLEDSLALGLILLGATAGAPFLPKLAQMAKGDIPYSVGLMILLMVATVAFIPLVVTPLIPTITVTPWEIAKPLVYYMLVPMAVALGVRARYDEAKNLVPHANQISTMALALAAVIGLVIVFPTLIGVWGTGAFLSAALLTLVTLGAGYLLGGRRRETRVVSALGTAQRNVAAALLIATTSFADNPNVLVMVLVGSLIMLVILLPLAAEWGRRAPESGAAGAN